MKTAELPWPWIDDRGRIFGKVNLIDAAAVVFVLVLLPLAYGAHAMFRQPPPTIQSVAPTLIPFGVGASVLVKGLLLRPTAYARLNNVPVTYRRLDTNRAELEIPRDFAAGTYFLKLYEDANLSATWGEPIIIAQTLPSRNLLTFRPRWTSATVDIQDLARTIDEFEHTGYAFYSLFPCENAVCVVARKYVVMPLIQPKW